MHTLKNIEPEKVYARPDKYTGDDETKFKTIISDLTDRELMAIVGWVKQVPGKNCFLFDDKRSRDGCCALGVVFFLFCGRRKHLLKRCLF